MANDVNVVTLVGNVVRTLGESQNDFSYTQGGMAVAHISIASNRNKKQQDGTWGSEVSYFDVTIFGKTAENLKQYLIKGRKIAVSGYLKQDRWKDQQGNNRSRVGIIANDIQLLGNPNSDNGQQGGFNPATVYPTAQAAQQADKQGYQQQYQQTPTQNYQQNQYMAQPVTNAQATSVQQNYQQYQPQIPQNEMAYPEDIPF